MSKRLTVDDIHYRLKELEDDIKIIGRGVKLQEESLRDTLAMHAPISYEVALAVWGDDSPYLHQDLSRASFFSVWAMLQYEWADAMLTARQKGNKE